MLCVSTMSVSLQQIESAVDCLNDLLSVVAFLASPPRLVCLLTSQFWCSSMAVLKRVYFNSGVVLVVPSHLEGLCRYSIVCQRSVSGCWWCCLLTCRNPGGPELLSVSVLLLPVLAPCRVQEHHQKASSTSFRNLSSKFSNAPFLPVCEVADVPSFYCAEWFVSEDFTRVSAWLPIRLTIQRRRMLWCVHLPRFPIHQISLFIPTQDVYFWFSWQPAGQCVAVCFLPCTLQNASRHFVRLDWPHECSSDDLPYLRATLQVCDFAPSP